MALIQINADLGRTATALEKIAHLLEWLLALWVNPALKQAYLRGTDVVPRPKVNPPTVQTAGPRVSAPSDYELWEREIERERKARASR